jgi:hypothetical protein
MLPTNQDRKGFFFEKKNQETFYPSLRKRNLHTAERLSAWPAPFGRAAMEKVILAEPRLPAPCVPARHHRWHAQVVGRIRRHGTRRIAHRLRPPPGGCLPGSLAALKLAVPAALIVGGVTAASIQAAHDTSWAGMVADDPGGVAGGLPGGTLHVGGHGHHHIVNLQEPPSLVLLLLGLLAWMRLKRMLRPRSVRRT